jgi:hypothetical protein
MEPIKTSKGMHGHALVGVAPFLAKIKVMELLIPGGNARVNDGRKECVMMVHGDPDKLTLLAGQRKRKSGRQMVSNYA